MDAFQRAMMMRAVFGPTAAPARSGPPGYVPGQYITAVITAEVEQWVNGSDQAAAKERAAQPDSASDRGGTVAVRVPEVG